MAGRKLSVVIVFTVDGRALRNKTVISQWDYSILCIAQLGNMQFSSGEKCPTYGAPQRQSRARGPLLTLDSCARGLPVLRRTRVRALILAATVAAFAAGPAFAEGNGGTIFGYDRWQAANGNPSIPATQWNSMTPDQRQAMQHKMQQDGRK